MIIEINVGKVYLSKSGKINHIFYSWMKKFNMFCHSYIMFSQMDYSLISFPNYFCDMLILQTQYKHIIMMMTVSHFRNHLPYMNLFKYFFIWKM